MTLFLLCFPAYSQENIVYLEEVVVTSQSTKRLKDLRTRGRQNAYYSLAENILFVSKIKKKQGFSSIVKTVTIFFSNERSANPKKTEFELLFFDENEKGKPGKPLGDAHLFFQVSKTEKSKVTINVSSANIKVKKDFFVGIRRIDKDTEGNFYIDINHKKNDVIYLKLPTVNEWQALKGQNVAMEITYREE